MEMIKKKNTELKNMWIGFGVIILYLIASSIPYEFLSLFGINYNNLSFLIKQLYLLIYEISLTLIIVYIYRHDFIPNFKEFKKNICTYFNKYFKYWILMLLLMGLSNIIITKFTTTMTSENQQSIVSLLGQAPVYTIIITMFVAPILEELVFRLSIRKIFAHTNILFIFFSGLLFGSMHVLGSLENLIDLLFIIPYSIPGFMFAYLYTKEKNIFLPISIHFLHNSVMLLLQIIISLI